MLHHRFALACALALTVAARPAAAASAALDSLVAAERAFSALSVREGIKTSFLTYLAGDAIVFRPTATNGPKAVEAQQSSNMTLIWEPEYAEVSAAGDLGFTTGPWELRRLDPNRPFAGWGHFISVWKKQKSGQWRVVVDIGTEHDQPVHSVGSVDFTAGSTPARHGSSGKSPVSLTGEDRTLAKLMKATGISASYGAMGAPDMRFHRDQLMPIAGVDSVKLVIGRMPGYFDYRPEGQRVAASGDLGCTWGVAQQHPPGGATRADSCVYVHIWRRNAASAWKLALEVLNPLRRN
jgi:ketosteroid isomerase-like protein